jgi:nitrogen fixation NifU-like protein
MSGAPKPLSASDEAVYQEAILAHYRKPNNRGALAGANTSAHVSNPTCGEEMTVEAIVDGGVVREARFTGSACSLATASASMMTDMAKGASIGAITRTRAALERLLRREPETRDALGALIAFEPVARHPARIDCVLMPWRALETAVSRS